MWNASQLFFQASNVQLLPLFLALDQCRPALGRGEQVRLWRKDVCGVQPMARSLGIEKKMSWHTFRRTFSSILKGNGEDVKVVQELLRHSTSRMTLDTYTQASGPRSGPRKAKL